MVGPAIATAAAGTAGSAGGGAAMATVRAGTTGATARGAAAAGDGKAMTQGIDSIFKTLKNFLPTVVKIPLAILGYVKKISSVLEKTSPALAQQFIIMRKSLMVILRPIGDIMAKWLRPMAIHMLRFAVRWYELFGKGAGSEDGKDAMSDKKEQLEQRLITAKSKGDTERAAKLQKEIDDITKSLNPIRYWAGKIWDEYLEPSWSKATDWVTNLWDEYVAPPWEAVKNWVTKLWDEYLAPAWENVSDWPEFIWDTYLKPAWSDVSDKISEAFSPIKKRVKEVWDTYVEEPFKDIKDWLKEVWDTSFVKPFDSITTWLKTLWDDKVVPPFEKFDSWVYNLWVDIKSAFDKMISRVKNWSPIKKIRDDWKEWKADKDKEKKEGKAWGGDVASTGYYKLHAGERVLTAGETSRNSSSTMNISNTYNINASINNDMDIRTLARKLAQLNETEIRRRVSYV